MTESADQILTLRELQDAIGKATQDEDIEALENLRQYFVVTDTPPAAPFTPPIGLNESLIKDPPTAAEGNAGIALGNALDRAGRQWNFHQRIRSGYNGPIIVSEGDSWFQYPILLDDVIDHINDDYAVFSLGGAGHTLSEMVNVQNEYFDAIQEHEADFFLLSGGGNDMLGSGQLERFVKPFQNGMMPADLISRTAFNQFRQTIAALYNQVASELTRDFPSLTMLVHGYDYVLPRQNGQWLGKPLANLDIPQNLWAQVLAIMINEFNEELLALESRFPGRVFHVDCRNQVGRQLSSWDDELHPKSAGSKRVAARFLERIRAVQSTSVTPRRFVATPSEELASKLQQKMLESSSPGSPEMAKRFMDRTRAMRPGPHPNALSLEAIVNNPLPQFTPAAITADTPASVTNNGALPTATPPDTDTSVTDSQMLKAWRDWFKPEDIEAYQHYVELSRELSEIDEAEQLRTRQELANDGTFERIINQSNLFAINFLSRGSLAARSVGRISVVSQFDIELGSGTGFLIAPGLLITNNHVLPVPEDATNSHVLFNYEFDDDNGFKQTERFDFTSEIFVTDESCDFTIVSVSHKGSNGSPIETYGSLPLIRQSGKALKGEPVSIIQHPDGDPKQIAMRDSQIIGRKEQYIYYTTDTNPGSSGAPVVNDEWLPVALHHRAVADYNAISSYVANRGIRTSCIVAKLDEAASSGNQSAQTILKAIEPGAFTSSAPNGSVPHSTVSPNDVNGSVPQEAAPA